MAARPRPTHCDWCEAALTTPFLNNIGAPAPRFISLTTETVHGPNRITFQPYRVCSTTCAAEYFANLDAENPEWQRPKVQST